MMEGRARDVSLIKLRRDLLRFAPGVAARFGVFPDDAEELLAQGKALEQRVSADGEADVDEGELVGA